MQDNNLKLLNQFANADTLAEHIKVEINCYHKSFKPRNENSYAKYEDCNLLASVIVGAERLLYWIERNGYKIQKAVKK